MIGLGWLSRLWRAFHDAGEELKRLKEEERRELDHAHKGVQSGKLTGEDVRICCESITLQLKKRGVK